MYLDLYRVFPLVVYMIGQINVNPAVMPEFTHKKY